MPTALPLPLTCLRSSDVAGLRGILTDIDDTLTTAGAITADARAALVDLRAAGLPVIAITGRPAGWSEPVARDEPVDAVVAENGAVALFRDAGGGLRIEFAQPADERERHARRLAEVAARVLREVPGSTLARDSAGRITDIAVDHAEFARLAPAQVARVVALMREAGMTATVSSIHVNGWFGAHDKRSGAGWIVRRLFGRDFEAERERWLYIGDSPNDQAMFACCPLSVGVANLREHAAALHTWPRFLASAERGAGVAEVARAVLGART